MNAFPTISMFQNGEVEALDSNVSGGDMNKQRSVQCAQLM